MNPLDARALLKTTVIFLLVVFSVLAGIGLILFLTAKPSPDYAWFSPRSGDHRPLVLAHQGGEGEWPSNTMFAFQQSAEAGADVLDADVHSTRDDVLVLLHDPTVERTTNGTGAIADLTLNQIKQLDAGYDFTPDNGRTFPYRGKSIRVPTLEEFFAAYPDKRLGVEIKPHDAIVVPKLVCDMIRKYRLQESVLISSFHQESMDSFRNACPEVATSATTDEVKMFIRLNTLQMARLLSPVYRCFQVPEKTRTQYVLTEQFVIAARERNLQILPWTINEEEDLRRIIGLGVEGINTDYPTRLLNILNE